MLKSGFSSDIYEEYKRWKKNRPQRWSS